MSQKLPIFDIMARMDKNDLTIRDSIPEDQLKEFDSFVGFPALRWLSSAPTYSEHLLCLMNTNEVNKHYFDIWKHKDMQAKLMACAGIGKRTKHTYIKGPESKRKSKLYDLILSYYPDFDYEDCDQFITECDRDDIKSLAMGSDLYEDAASIKPVMDEYKKIVG